VRLTTTGLLDAVLDAHGGLDRWQRFSTIEATIVTVTVSAAGPQAGMLADPVGR
jgi:hypothetical protein